MCAVIRDGDKFYKNDLWQGMTKGMLLEGRGVPLEYNIYSRGNLYSDSFLTLFQV